MTDGRGDLLAIPSGASHEDLRRWRSDVLQQLALIRGLQEEMAAGERDLVVTLAALDGALDAVLRLEAASSSADGSVPRSLNPSRERQEGAQELECQDPEEASMSSSVCLKVPVRVGPKLDPTGRKTALLEAANRQCGLAFDIDWATEALLSAGHPVSRPAVAKLLPRMVENKLLVRAIRGRFRLPNREEVNAGVARLPESGAEVG